MKQKRINDVLYVYSLEPYVITTDTDADIIFVQEELFDEYKKLNPTLDQLAKKNYDILTVITPEWNKYRYLPEEKEDPDVQLNAQMAVIPLINVLQDGTVVTDINVTGFQILNDGGIGVEYDSSDNSVATIDEGGYVNIEGAGVTIISADYAGDEQYNEYHEEYTLEVNDADQTGKTDPQLEAGTTTLYHGESAPINVTNPYNVDVVYSTDTDNIVIDQNGIVTSESQPSTISEYPVYITCTGENPLFFAEQVIGSVQVLQARENADIEWLYDGQTISDTINVALDSENTFPTLSNIHNLEVTYSVSDTDYATIDQNGNITLIASTGADTISVNAIFAGNDNYKPATVSYSLKIKATSKGYAFTTVRPTVATLPTLMDLDATKPTTEDTIDMTDLTKPTNMYLVFPKDWEVVEDGFIEKPIVTDDANGGEMGMWWDEENPVLVVDEKQYRIECIQLGKGTFTISF